MKTLEITTNKRLLIVEKQIEVNGQNIDISESIIFGVEKMMKGKAKFICRGSDLTKEIAGEMVHQEEIDGTTTYMQYDCTCNNYFDENLSALESFISAIEAAGKTWGNPVQKPDKSSNYYFSEMSEYFKAENNAYHPERVLIFEIVEG